MFMFIELSVNKSGDEDDDSRVLIAFLSWIMKKSFAMETPAGTFTLSSSASVSAEVVLSDVSVVSELCV